MLRAKQHIARFEGDVINDNGDKLRPNQYPLVAQGEYSSPRQEVDCRGMLSKLSSKKTPRHHPLSNNLILFLALHYNENSLFVVGYGVAHEISHDVIDLCFLVGLSVRQRRWESGPFGV